MRQEYRIWWPRLVSCCGTSASIVLFGWCISYSASIDIVVAFACDEIFISQCQTGFEDILHYTNEYLSVPLLEKSKLSIIGHCATDSFYSGSSLSTLNGKDNQVGSSCDYCECPLNSLGISINNCKLQICRHRVGRLPQLFSQSSLQSFNCWVQLYNFQEFCVKRNHWVPKFHHAHHNGKIVIDCDVHVIMYETPTFGSHYYSLFYWNNFEQPRSLKTWNWINKLHQKKQIPDLDTIILAINSANASKVLFEEQLKLKGPFVWSSIVSMFVKFLLQVITTPVTIFSTFLYIIIQCLHQFFSFPSHLWISTILEKIFVSTFKVITIRCFQILYWPVFLQDKRFRSQSCVQYAERAAFSRHSMWSSIVVDVVLGNIIGLALLYNAGSVCLWILKFASYITNNLLRIGCVWLMGAPAGFKLNTELAEILGMISLNVIQIWSTLWFFMGFYLSYFVKGLALCGVFLGATVPVAVVLDLIALANLHIISLRWLISLLYSFQIHSLASLCRLFRGRKWNTLRKRLDSYDYSVEQHIVGSLVFTPLLLLLPTTCAFYIFFSIMSTGISLACILLEITISIIHTMPCMQALVWLVRRGRFPCGIWFEILSVNGLPFLETGESYESGSSRSNTKVSVLRSNLVNLGGIVLPHFKKAFHGVVSVPFLWSLAYGVILGRRIPISLGSISPLELPWMTIPWWEYWRLCRDSIMHTNPVNSQIG